MKIVKLDLYKAPPRWLFLKITTDEGIVGWGEPIVEGKADTVKAAVEEMSGYLIGRDPRQIEDIWQVLYRCAFYRGGVVLASAMSGIDQALWDIKGKYYNMPVYEMLGGACREKVPVYYGTGGDTPEEMARNAKKVQELGYKATKTGVEPTNYIDSFKKVEELCAKIAATREACGSDFGIAIDFHGRVHKAMAKVMARELRPYHLMFIEEPVLSENMEAFSDIAEAANCPIATGERLYTRWDFKRLCTQGAVDIVQPDLSHAGGILECKKIASMAEAFDMSIAPHCPLGPIAFASCIQLDACTPNAVTQEQSVGIHKTVGNDQLVYLKDPGVFHYKDGYVTPPKAPGLGIEIDEEKVIEGDRIGHDWKNPVLRRDDGIPCEW